MALITWLRFAIVIITGEDTAVTPVRRPDSSMDETAATTKSNRDVEIKQERMETSSSHEEEESPLGGKTKKLRIEVADAESNTLNSGEYRLPSFLPLLDIQGILEYICPSRIKITAGSTRLSLIARNRVD